MLFNSAEFLLFFLAVFSVYWLVRGREVRIWLLLAASYYFYMSWNVKLAGVVAVSSLVDFFLGCAIEDSGSQGKRKTLLTASIVMNLGLLFYFKYSNFFLGSLHDALSRLGIQNQMPVLKLVLPIGISFYTFEAISYTVDVYWKRTKAERSPIHFLLFITFFPRMVAGPIIRAKNFLPQLRGEKTFSWARFELGLQYVLIGLFKKMAIADRMACLVDPVYQFPGQYSTSAAWVAVLAYSLQIYCDFSGYSDIAIGTAHMLGFKLPENFNMPYFSRNIAEFWRRWHISLSTWLRDYVFISLGGSRGTLLRTTFTLIATFALCGLWHGAQWTFVAWGLLQGAMMIVHRFFGTLCKGWTALKAFLETRLGVFLRVLLTYLTFSVSLVLFRSQDFATASEICKRLFTSQPGMMVRHPIGPWGFVFSFVVVLIAHIIASQPDWRKILGKLPLPAWGLAYAAMLALICVIRVEGQKAFIYFQF